MKPILKLEQDEYPDNPREQWDHIGKMVCWHRRHNLGDVQPSCSPNEYFRSLAAGLVNADEDKLSDEHVTRILDKHCVILPLYLYDHSGITMRTGPFDCPWDSGQVGFIYITMKRARKEWQGTDEEIRKQAIDCLNAEVSEYDSFLTGDVWRYSIEDEETDETLDSRCGFYGQDYCQKEGEEALKHFMAKAEEIERETETAEQWP